VLVPTRDGVEWYREIKARELQEFTPARRVEPSN
jgi:hypothetical protein